MVKVYVYHPSVEVKFLVEVEDVVDPNPDDCGYNFRKVDFDGLNAFVDLIHWDAELRDCAGV